MTTHGMKHNLMKRVIEVCISVVSFSACRLSRLLVAVGLSLLRKSKQERRTAQVTRHRITRKRLICAIDVSFQVSSGVTVNEFHSLVSCRRHTLELDFVAS